MIIPKIARLLFAFGLTLTIYVLVTPGDQTIAALIGGGLMGLGASLNWGEDREEAKKS